MGTITTHILDVSRGRPASGVAVRLERVDDESSPRLLGIGRTDPDGRLRTLMDGAVLQPGPYRLTFSVGEYFAAVNVDTFYPTVQVTFDVKDAGQHYHVPLLVSPFGYSTYRGS
jgi:5-hydroxyisourate hydrolase